MLHLLQSTGSPVGLYVGVIGTWCTDSVVPRPCLSIGVNFSIYLWTDTATTHRHVVVIADINTDTVTGDIDDELVIRPTVCEIANTYAYGTLNE